MDKQLVLLNPGPVNTTRNVKNALCKPDICHREKEFTELLGRVREKILHVAGVSNKVYTVVCFTGSGTAAVEASLTRLAGRGEKALVVINGIYGRRMARILEIAGADVIALTSDWTKPPDIEAIKDFLATDREIACVAMVHHETTTGLLNPVEEIGKLCRELGKILMLDAVSSFCGEPLDIQGSGVNAICSTASKCIHGMPGVSFIVVEKALLERIRSHPPASLYLDPITYYDMQERGEVPFTPGIPAFYALDAALDELIQNGGVDARIRHYERLSGMLHRGFAEMGFEFLVEPAYRSRTITSLKLPEGWDYDNLHDYCKKSGYVIYAGQGKLAGSIFRVANMGDLNEKHIEAFLNCIARYKDTR